MALNITSMRNHRKKREARQSGGESEWFNPDTGEHLIYIAGVCRPEDDLNYAEVSVHYKIGPNNNMVVSLDPQSNPILKHPDVAEILKENGIKTGKCPVNAEYMRRKASGDDDGAKAIGRSGKFIFNIIPIAKRAKPSQDWDYYSEYSLMPYMVGPTVWEGILDVFFSEGDITNPEEAIYIKLVKSGKGLSTRYKISVDSKTLRKPAQLGEETTEMLNEALVKGGEGDLYAMVANMVKSYEHVEALFKGVEYDPSTSSVSSSKSSSKKSTSSAKGAKDSMFPDDLDALERELASRSKR